MNWIRLFLFFCLTWMSGYAFNYPELGAYWFVSKAAVCFIFIAACVAIGTGLSLLFACFELFFIAVTLSAVVEYTTGLLGYSYLSYEVILESVAVFEILLLIFTAPYDRILSFLRGLFPGFISPMYFCEINVVSLGCRLFFYREESQKIEA